MNYENEIERQRIQEVDHRGHVNSPHMNNTIKNRMIESRERVIHKLRIKSIAIPSDTLEGKQELNRIVKRINLLYSNIEFLKSEY